MYKQLNIFGDWIIMTDEGKPVPNVQTKFIAKTSQHTLELTTSTGSDADLENLIAEAVQFSEKRFGEKLKELQVFQWKFFSHTDNTNFIWARTVKRFKKYRTMSYTPVITAVKT